MKGLTDHVKKLRIYLKGNGKILNRLAHGSGTLEFAFFTYIQIILMPPNLRTPGLEGAER